MDGLEGEADDDEAETLQGGLWRGGWPVGGGGLRERLVGLAALPGLAGGAYEGPARVWGSEPAAWRGEGEGGASLSERVASSWAALTDALGGASGIWWMAVPKRKVRVWVWVGVGARPGAGVGCGNVVGAVARARLPPIPPRPRLTRSPAHPLTLTLAAGTT